MTEIHKELENARFNEPEGIIKKTVCRISGKLASEACGANVYTELFTESIVPKTVCEGHGQIRVCKDSKQMATHLCPNVLDIMGYLPEKERDAVWKTENALTTDITITCPLHGGGGPINQPAEPQQPQQPTQDNNQQQNNTTTPEKPAKCEHKNTETQTTAATCSKKGSIVVKCKDCKETIKTTEIPKLAHTPGTPEETKPTCTADGTKVTKCTVCQEVIKTEPNGKATGHNFVEGKCTVCQEKDLNYKPTTPPSEGGSENPNPGTDSGSEGGNGSGSGSGSGTGTGTENGNGSEGNG